MVKSQEDSFAGACRSRQLLHKFWNLGFGICSFVAAGIWDLQTLR